MTKDRIRDGRNIYLANSKTKWNSPLNFFGESEPNGT